MTAPLLSKEISAELFFLYDTHCPWSYVTTKLVNEINKAFPNITLHLWHAAFFEGSTRISMDEVSKVEKLADMRFSTNYQNALEQNKNSILAANLMTWAEHKTPDMALPLLNAMQQAHFEQGNKLSTQADLDNIINELKLSPPAKVFKNDKLSKDALVQLEEIFALQELINTEAIPALLLAVDDQLILLNHNFYLTQPKAIVEAVQLELNKHQLNPKNK
jgi:protein-disulfide isomerase-like protein with CxxC motif